MTLRGRGAVAAGLVLAVAVATAPAAPAGAVATARCSSTAVRVVVDFNELGGEEVVGCAEQGGTAAELFREVGVTLEYQPQLGDFVCRVGGLPADRRCTEADAYWSLWWADRDADGWTYATLGVASLSVPDGGSVGFAWHRGDEEATPPDLPAEASANGTGGVATTADEAAPDRPADDDVRPSWALVIGALLALGAAAVVPLRRRRSG